MTVAGKKLKRDLHQRLGRRQRAGHRGFLLSASSPEPCTPEQEEELEEEAEEEHREPSPCPSTEPADRSPTEVPSECDREEQVTSFLLAEAKKYEKSESDEDEHKRESFGLVVPPQEPRLPHSFVFDRGDIPSGSNTRIVEIAGIGTFETPVTPVVSPTFTPPDRREPEEERVSELVIDRVELARVATQQADERLERAEAAAEEATAAEERAWQEALDAEEATNKWERLYLEKSKRLRLKRTREEDLDHCKEEVKEEPEPGPFQ